MTTIYDVTKVNNAEYLCDFCIGQRYPGSVVAHYMVFGRQIDVCVDHSRECRAKGYKPANLGG